MLCIHTEYEYRGNFVLLIIPRSFSVVFLIVLCLGVECFVLLAPDVCFHVLVKFW